MTIKVGDRLPAGKLSEFIEVETAGCTIGPNEFSVEDLTRGTGASVASTGTVPSSASPAPSPRPARRSTCRAISRISTR